jgi:hypothetical protein
MTTTNSLKGRCLLVQSTRLYPKGDSEMFEELEKIFNELPESDRSKAFRALNQARFAKSPRGKLDGYFKLFRWIRRTQRFLERSKTA